jgi:hypothetical protein
MKKIGRNDPCWCGIPVLQYLEKEIMTKNDILINLSESEKTSFGKQDFASQSLPQKVFSAIWAVESEVNSGESLSIS